MSHTPPDVRLMPTDPGHVITITAEAEFTVVLTANHSTGYSWELAKPTRRTLVEHVSTRYEQEQVAAGPNPVAGAGGYEIWTFRAVAQGRTRLTFHYRRPWETNSAPAEITRFAVRIK
ncbi:MAG TPA: protease inhibitor I42 family protein [Chloroflexia bacterium]|nr:protease inhibitor I42 family protein [Chloroflexia bacterium]